MNRQSFEVRDGASSRQYVSLSGLLVLMIVGPLQAQTADQSPAPAADATPAPVADATQQPGPTEEVVVTGERTIRFLINEAGRETENFYMRLNEVLDNDDFRITCRSEYPAGTNIATKICRTRFQERIESRTALSDLQNIQSTDEGILVYEGTRYQGQPEMLRMQREFGDAMLQAVNSDQELNDAFWRLVALKRAVDNYETPREVRRRERDEAEAAGAAEAN